MKKHDFLLAKTLSNSSIKKINCIVYTKNIQALKPTLRQLGLITIQDFPFINAVSVSGTTDAIKKLFSLENVKFISSQTQVFAMMNIARKILGTKHFGDGDGQTIAYIDTGISPHLDFTLGKNRIVKFIDIINHKIFPYDDNGHGTFVAGVGSGNGLISSGKYSGISPKSNIISIKALDQTGEANAIKILEAMQWIYDNHKKYNIKVVCMSFGSEPLGANDPIMQGAEKLWEQNIVVASAAGNSGPEYKTIKSPGISSKIITVGGFDDNRIDNQNYLPEYFEIAKFSSRGPALDQFKPDLVAPAVEITSCGLTTPYTTLSGTSVATPMVAGICALLLEQNPTLTPTEIKEILINNSTPITFNKNQEGGGFLNFHASPKTSFYNFKP